MTRINGFLNIDKPQGATSRDVVNRIAGQFRGLKVGHAGTLDPLATGVLVVAIGSATRLVDLVQRMRKTYTTTIRLGATSDTDDADGTIETSDGCQAPDHEQLTRAVAGQVGAILQVPPQYSAIKREGKRAYAIARSGGSIVLEPRRIDVHRIDIQEYQWPKLVLEIECGSGTYIRSIARDLGVELGCGGLVEVLTRTRIGEFSIADAIDPEGMDGGSLAAVLIPPGAAVWDLRAVVLDCGRIGEILQGKAIAVSEFELRCESSEPEVAVFDHSGNLVAIAEHVRSLGLLRPKKVLVAQSHDSEANPGGGSSVSGIDD